MTRGALAERLRQTYLQIDLRSLALGRIFLGLVLLADLLRRVPLLRDFYSNLGLIPNHTVLWRPPFPRIFSVFFMASLPEESALWFCFAFVCFFCFMIGYRTRLFHLLSFAMTTSLHNRILGAENWGGVAIGVLMVWTAFLPLGRRFSVDAIRASLRARPDETPAELAAGVPPPDLRPTTSLAALGLLLQIGVIYWLNFLHKSGPTWHNGSAVHYVLWQERIVTWVGLQVRTHAPYAFTKFLTEATLVIEASAAFLVLTPIFWRWTRFVAALLLIGLHGGIALLVNLGIFSVAMMAFQPFLLTDAQWTLFARLVPKRGRARTVYYDVDCGICWAVVRVLARMDVHRRLTLHPQQRRGRSADRRRARAARADHPGRRPRARSPLDARRGVRRDLRRAAARSALGLADAPARRERAGRPRLRSRRAQPDGDLDLVRPGRLWRAGRAGAGEAAGPPRRRSAPGSASSCRSCASSARRWCSSCSRPRPRWPIRPSRPSFASRIAPSGWRRRSCTRTSSRGGRSSRRTRRSPTRPSTSTR